MSTPSRAASAWTAATGEDRWVRVPPLSNRTASKRIVSPLLGGGSMRAGCAGRSGRPRGEAAGRLAVVAGTDMEVVEDQRAQHEHDEDDVAPHVDGRGLVHAQRAAALVGP